MKAVVVELKNDFAAEIRYDPGKKPRRKRNPHRGARVLIQGNQFFRTAASRFRLTAQRLYVAVIIQGAYDIGNGRPVAVQLPGQFGTRHGAAVLQQIQHRQAIPVPDLIVIEYVIFYHNSINIQFIYKKSNKSLLTILENTLYSIL